MGKGLDFDELYPGRFMKAGEFKDKDVTLKIASVTKDKLEGSKGEETKGVIRFEKTEKALVLNKTNGVCIREMFGRDTGEWVGKRVTFFPAKVDFEDSDLAIRVRGSPDIPADIAFQAKVGRKLHKFKLYRTGQQRQHAAPSSQPEPPPLGDAPEQYADPGPPEDYVSETASTASGGDS